MLNRNTEAPILPSRCCTQPFLSVRNVDVLEGFKSIEDKSQDLIIADPPYYKAINEKWDKQWKTEEEYLDWCKLWFNECVRVLKDTGSFYCYGNFDILSKQKVLIFDKQLIFRQNITLDKGLKSIAGRTSDKLRMFPTASEYLLFYVKKNDNGTSVNEYLRSELNRFGIANDVNKHFWKNGWAKQGSNIASHFFGNNEQNCLPTIEQYERLQTTGYFQKKYTELEEMYFKDRFVFNLPMAITDVWDFTPDKVRYGHPTQKPQNISQRIVKASSNENDNVLIPFGGSGSEIVACQELKRNCIVFETESQYVDIINQRLNYAPKLF
jgi:DNA modification methylase